MQPRMWEAKDGVPKLPSIQLWLETACTQKEGLGVQRPAMRSPGLGLRLPTEHPGVTGLQVSWEWSSGPQGCNEAGPGGGEL